jgi:hypothetical protein
MKSQVPGSKPSPAAKLTSGDFEEDRLRLKRKTLQAVLDQCQRAVGSLGTTTDGGDDDDEKEEGDKDSGSGGEAIDEGKGWTTTLRADCEANEVNRSLILFNLSLE